MVTLRRHEVAQIAPAKPSSRQIRQEKHKKAALCLIGAISGVASVLTHVAPLLDKRPMHTSSLTGQKWVEELLMGALYMLYDDRT